VQGKPFYFYGPDQVAGWQRTPGRPQQDIDAQMRDPMGLNFLHLLRPVKKHSGKKTSSFYPKGAVLMRFHPLLVKLGYVQPYHYTVGSTVLEATIQSLGMVTGLGGLSCVYEISGSMGKLRSPHVGLFGGGQAVEGRSPSSAFFIRPLAPSHELVQLLPEALKPTVLEYLYNAGVLHSPLQSLTASPCSSVCPSPSPPEGPRLLAGCYYEEDSSSEEEPDLCPEPRDAVDALMALRNSVPADRESPVPEPPPVVRQFAVASFAFQEDAFPTPPPVVRQFAVSDFAFGQLPLKEPLTWVFDGMSGEETDEPVVLDGMLVQESPEPIPFRRAKIVGAFEKHQLAASAAASQSPVTEEQVTRKRKRSNQPEKPVPRSTRSRPDAELLSGDVLLC
jgi:hypothetical protein